MESLEREREIAIEECEESRIGDRMESARKRRISFIVHVTQA